MPDDIEAILARVEEELGEDSRAVLAEALGLDGDDGRSGSDLPDDVDEARAEEMKAGGDGDDEPVTREDLEAALEDAVTQSDLAEMVEGLEASTREAVMDALPEIADEVGQKMATGGGVDYTGAIGETYGRGPTATGLERGRTPTGAGSGGTARKMETGQSESNSVDYAEDIAAAFSTGD